MSSVIQFPLRKEPTKQPTLAELELELFRAVNGYDGQKCNRERILGLRDAILRYWIGGPQSDEGGSAA